MLVEIEISEAFAASIITTFLMMDAVSTSETSVDSYQSTRLNIPGDNHFQRHQLSYMSNLCVIRLVVNN
jgi:hypothetical protein